MKGLQNLETSLKGKRDKKKDKKKAEEEEEGEKMKY